MKTIRLRTRRSAQRYDIDFYQRFTPLKRALNEQLKGRKCVIVTDKNVLKETKFFTPAQRQKPPTNIVVLKPGEKSKNWDSIDKILKASFDSGLDRDSVIIAVGGGVVGDMAGFAASVFMRGIPCIQVPTTLLGMVDASVGGKTGIDSEYGKNLIGSIVQPEAVMVCEAFLKTLPDLEIRNGLAEMVKHGVIADLGHFKKLEKLAKQPFKSVRKNVFALVRDSIMIKKAIVEADEREQGKRQWLNYGHTFGHAIEQVSDYRVPHGRAVAIGCVMEAQYAADRKVCSPKVVDRIESLFHQFGIDLAYKITQEKLWSAMRFDKKKSGDQVRIVVPKKIGKVVIISVKI